MPISSIWKRNFRFFFLGLWWEPHLKTGFPCLFGLFWKIMPISSIWKRDFPFFGLGMGTSGKQCQYLLFKNGISVVLFGLWWEPLENNANIVSFSHGISVSFWAFLENNANIFYLKTGFLFFWACDGNLWKIIYLLFDNGISVFFSGLVMGTSFENGISLFLGLWWEPLENNANIFYLKTEFPCFFWACDGNLWKIMPIASIWKRDFRVFLGFSGK